MHTAAHPTHPTAHRATTQRRPLGVDLDQLEQLGCNPVGRLATMHCADTSTIRDCASRGELAEHDLLYALTLDALRSPRT